MGNYLPINTGYQDQQESQGLHNSQDGTVIRNMNDAVALGKKQNTLWKQGKSHHKKVLNKQQLEQHQCKKQLHSEMIESTDVTTAK